MTRIKNAVNHIHVHLIGSLAAFNSGEGWREMGLSEIC